MRVMLVFGTRPETIKMAPVYHKLKDDGFFEPIICVTAQHRQMLDQFLEVFELKADYDLNVMQANQDLFDVTSRVLIGMRDVLREAKPDVVLVHGDTTTAFSAALAAFYEKVPVGHVEAGLRTYNMMEPFPEEGNRSLISKVTKFHFAPTKRNESCLLKEGIAQKNMWVTGNTVIDALFWMRERLKGKTPNMDAYGSAKRVFDSDQKVVLITGHRRENFGEGFLSICRAIATLANKHPDVEFVYPVHLNPNVQKPVKENLGNLKNVHLINPLDYPEFVYLMDRSHVILTDSGGVQEEAPSLGKPVLVMRNTTERPEAVDAGTVLLVGTDEKRIVSETDSLLTDVDRYRKMAANHNPYGDGKASMRIADALKSNFKNK